MQGERASLGSLAEALNFEHGSTSSNAVIDQPIRWDNNIHSYGDNGLQDYMISAAADTNPTFANSVYHEQGGLHRFNIGEASSSGTKNETTSHTQQWNGIGRFEEQRNGKLELNPLFAQPSNGNRVVRHVNLNAEYNEHLDDVNPVTGHPALFEANGLRSRFIPEDSVRDGRRVSCKRKALDASIGQSSSSGGFREVQRGESSSWISPSAYYSPAMTTNDLNLSLDRRRGLVVSNAVSNVSAPAITESSSRNYSVRVNPTDQQDTVSPSVFAAGSVIRRLAAPSLNSQGFPPADQQLIDLRYGHALGNFASQNPNAPATHMSPVFNLNASPVAAAVPSSSATPVERNVLHRDETRQINNSLQIPLFVPAPELRHVANGHISNNASSARHAVSSSSRTNVQQWQFPSPSPSLSNPAWNPYPSNNSPHNQGSLSEHLRRSLLSSLATTNQRAAARSLVPPASPPVEHVVQSGGENTSQVRTRASSRTSLRQRPHATTALRGRSRTASSEMRNVLEQMRRGGNLRLEDVMLQSMVRSVADLHDRHRDMRLDVDNMTYEELLSLEERIGDVCTGLNEETISNRLKKQKYNSSTGAPQEVEPCCVCQEEYNEGEELGILECGHNFHGQCIKEWLKLKNLCPICKTTGLNTANKRRRQ
ncbi:PREDICTED: probable E3 ubiquitin-protein ligase RHG1A [Camelina sativa]|uniref:RING-type E3 ubiquitin transferase n=1 Tax=Camelina sativa TaxID=90675 RepID=A0ABM0YFM0_CAMSA|nr:PREDICTED: probable E3 ubiquitin-protein ligase RHG1A [Camelina sativa]XP_010500195.1 PREDICTED: probable E3 ubiquitin-protein ligase RHG1A [Camelina sativa]